MCEQFGMSIQVRLPRWRSGGDGPQRRTWPLGNTVSPAPPARLMSLIIPLAIIVALMFVSPYALVVSIVLISVFLTMHPTIAITIGVTIALVIIIALRERLAGRKF